jgi:hypothetical protein
MGLNPDTSQNTKNGDISKGMANTLARTKKYTKKNIEKSSVSNPDPDSIRSLDPYPDPDLGSGSGSRRAKTGKKLENSCFEVLDVLFEG